MMYVCTYKRTWVGELAPGMPGPCPWRARARFHNPHPWV